MVYTNSTSGCSDPSGFKSYMHVLTTYNVNKKNQEIYVNVVFDILCVYVCRCERER